MILLGPDAVRRALPMGRAIEAMRDAFSAQALGDVQSPPRTVLETGGDRGATLVMAAALGPEAGALLTVKAVSVFPANPRRNLPAIHGTLLVIDSETGVPQALVDGASLTAIRTAAACGLATKLLARAESRTLVVFGSGVQAREQVRAVRCVLPIEEVRIFNPNVISAARMAAELDRLDPILGGHQVARFPDQALIGADVVCLATTSATPVLRDCDIPAGAHINAIGSFKPCDRELPTATVARARVVVDDRDAALEEAGDLLIPISEGVVGPDHICADLGNLALGRERGRRSVREVTLFKSVGLAVQDVAAANAALREARRRGLGRTLEW